jgi:hypothetical protein
MKGKATDSLRKKTVQVMYLCIFRLLSQKDLKQFEKRKWLNLMSLNRTKVLSYKRNCCPLSKKLGEELTRFMDAKRKYERGLLRADRDK